MVWMWNLFNKSLGANEISDKLSKFCSDVKLCCLRWIHHLLREKHCGEKVHWAGIWFCSLFVALCNKSWLLSEATVMLSYSAVVPITCALWWDGELISNALTWALVYKSCSCMECAFLEEQKVWYRTTSQWICSDILCASSSFKQTGALLSFLGHKAP